MILGIDATNWIHQLWHAHGGRGVLDSAHRRLEALVAKLQPSHVVAGFDRRSFRHDLAPTYKAHRQQKESGLVDVLAEAERDFAGVSTIAVAEGAEADDCLATLATAGDRVVLASPDKDLRQCLVDGRVTILRSFTTESGQVVKSEWFTARDLADVYGLTPDQWIDYQTLVGDAGDGVEGCPGWGEKTACKVLGKVKTLAEALRNPWACPVTAKQRVALESFRARADVVRRLVTLRTDVTAVWDAIR